MNAVRKIIENSPATITIELPKEYENKRLEVIVLQLSDNSQAKSSNNKYDFSDLTGKLSWNDDPVEYQKKIRDEWE